MSEGHADREKNEREHAEKLLRYHFYKGRLKRKGHADLDERLWAILLVLIGPGTIHERLQEVYSQFWHPAMLQHWIEESFRDYPWVTQKKVTTIWQALVPDGKKPSPDALKQALENRYEWDTYEREPAKEWELTKEQFTARINMLSEDEAWDWAEITLQMFVDMISGKGTYPRASLQSRDGLLRDIFG